MGVTGVEVAIDVLLGLPAVTDGLKVETGRGVLVPTGSEPSVGVTVAPAGSHAATTSPTAIVQKMASQFSAFLRFRYQLRIFTLNSLICAISLGKRNVMTRA